LATDDAGLSPPEGETVDEKVKRMRGVLRHFTLMPKERSARNYGSGRVSPFPYYETIHGLDHELTARHDCPPGSRCSSHDPVPTATCLKSGGDDENADSRRVAAA